MEFSSTRCYVIGIATKDNAKFPTMAPQTCYDFHKRTGRTSNIVDQKSNIDPTGKVWF